MENHTPAGWAKRHAAGRTRITESTAVDSAELERLVEQYAGRSVVVDAQRPELARMAGKRGRIITINCNGRALVQFDGVDTAWYDFDPDFLKLVEPVTEPVADPPAEPKT